MKEYDVIVVGSGAGLLVVENAIAHGLDVALVDRGPLGGTCLNLGCIPSKMLIYPADRIAEIRDSEKLGVRAEITDIDFASIMKRMKETVSSGNQHVRDGIQLSDALDFYEGEGQFVKDYVIEIKGERIKGRKIFLASGARPLIPSMDGIGSVEYLTNESVLEMKERPESIIIIGGGYIAAEYAHFFAAMGSKVTLVQRSDTLVPDEEPEISELLKKEMEKRLRVFTGMEAFAVKKQTSGYSVSCRDTDTGEETDLTAEKILIAAGRKSNADLLKVENTGVETDERNYIKVNEYFETNKKNIWAFGDAIGKKMFRHVANRAASLVWHNAAHDAKDKLDYTTAPHAVFTWPEIASVGLTESEARKHYRLHELLVGRARYYDVARGEAMREENGFAKAVVKRDSGKILGFHIIGPHASILIQEVILAKANDLDIWALARGMHIHPALPEVVTAAFGNLREVE